MGQQFAASEADLAMTMNVSASTLDETKGQESGTASGEGKFGIAGLSITVKVSASFSASEDHKRESDYRATTTASVKMTQGADAGASATRPGSVYENRGRGVQDHGSDHRGQRAGAGAGQGSAS